MSRSRQLERLLQIDNLLRSGERQTTTTLARACDVSDRTMSGDLAFLRDRYDAPLEFSRQRGWYYTDLTWRLPSIPLSSGELFALTLGSQMLSGYTGLYERELRDAIEQLTKRLPDSTWIDLQQLADERMVFGVGAKTAIDPEVWRTVVEATRSRCRLWVRYFAASRREESEREFDPYLIHVFRGSNPYLIGYCHLRREIRWFRIDRIRQVRLLDVKFQPDPTFDARKHLDRIFQAEAGGDPVSVEICFDAQTAPFVRERQWHSSQEIEACDDGAIVLRFTACGLNDIKRWVLGYGKGARVRKPQKLVDLVQREVETMARQYESGVFE
ncbi:helix-turn-helix transcriptional regulator [Baaleninema simplex]|uniref:helix-turn-helix transcriptional regulator n=1 Tax=Baaleninema simplex TaxID=2862350 RepID=UPI00034D537C|nr:WYL domain-containing protein [Baaleninema simplex]